jgi:hypothetical protein
MPTQNSPAVLATQTSRRALWKTAADVPPAVLTLVAIPPFATSGSKERREKGKGSKKE